MKGNSPKVGTNRWWVAHDQKVVTVQGKKWRLECFVKRGGLSVTAEMLDKSDPDYLRKRRQLGYPWFHPVLTERAFREECIAELLR